MTTIANAVKRLEKAGFETKVADWNPSVIYARKAGYETITLYRNGGENRELVAVIEVGKDFYTPTIPRAIRLATPRELRIA